jgi:hypothetical protein
MPVDGTKTAMAFRLVVGAKVESGQPETRDRRLPVMGYVYFKRPRTA